MHKGVFSLIAFLGLLAVAIGAFAAHGLKPRLSEQALQWMETGNRYHFYHTLAALAAACLHNRRPTALFYYSLLAFITGIVLFSGSLYVMALTGFTAAGIVTPLGGLSFMVGWLLLGFAVWKDFAASGH
ncbi:MAG: DUF423 domain-containing protein [Chitinophagales bacterium]|nr:MAG: DUF423 domain-containing protein [Chitinophagales bacterium]